MPLLINDIYIKKWVVSAPCQAILLHENLIAFLNMCKLWHEKFSISLQWPVLLLRFYKKKDFGKKIFAWPLTAEKPLPIIRTPRKKTFCCHLFWKLVSILLCLKTARQLSKENLPTWFKDLRFRIQFKTETSTSLEMHVSLFRCCSGCYRKRQSATEQLESCAVDDLKMFCFLESRFWK